MKPRDEPTKKGLICYYGGAFRDGGNGTSMHDTDRSYDSQYYATQTHLKLTDLIKRKGYTVDTMINTYHSYFEKELTKWYNPFNIILNTINKTGKSTDGRDKIIQSCVKNIKNMSTNDYDFVLFIRIDLFLKPEFYKILNIESEKVQFLAHNFYQGHCGFTDQKDPEVVDLILFIPKKYFYMLDNNFKLNHNSWSYYKKEYKLKNEDLHFMSDLRFDSNSYLDFNPYYIISGRPENTVVHNYEKTNPDLYGKVGNKRGKDCSYYKKIKDDYLKNPCEHYYNVHKNFYQME